MSNAGKWIQRSVIIVITLAFLATSVGFSIFIILDQRRKDDVNNMADQAQTDKTTEDQLQGTKLQNFTPVATVSALQKIDITPGTGSEVKSGDTVTAHYTGALAKDGTIFESSLDSGQAATFPLNGVIKGWQEGVPGMKVGGTRRLIIPADMAYGATGSPPAIGPNEPLVFDIQLIKIGE